MSQGGWGGVQVWAASGAAPSRVRMSPAVGEQCLLPSAMSQCPPRTCVRESSTIHHGYAVYQHVVDAIGVLVRRLEGRAVADCRRIEYDEVGVGSLGDTAPVPQAEAGGGEAGHLVDGLFEGEHAA